MDLIERVFPQLMFTDRQDVRLKNLQQSVYLCVTQGDKGYRLATKTLQAENLADLERKFVFTELFSARI
jgi:hypothetical protein